VVVLFGVGEQGGTELGRVVEVDLLGAPQLVFHFVEGTDVGFLEMSRLRSSETHAWKRGDGAHTVLVLEENDISLTNHQCVTDALAKVEAGMSDIPDEVFLVTTTFAKWQVSCLRRDGANYYDDDERFHEVDPATLTNLTKG
jgi:hypothetical protein